MIRGLLRPYDQSPNDPTKGVKPRVRVGQSDLIFFTVSKKEITLKGMIYQRRAPRKGYLNRNIYSWEKPNRLIYHFFLATTLTTLFLLGPFIYLVNQNFNFFHNLAIGMSPSLLGHLDREQLGLNILVIILIVSLFASNWWFSMKLLRNFRGQIHALELHLKHLIRGEWYTPPLRVRDQDEFKQIVDQYGYFYKSLQALTKAEIHLLEKMKIAPSDRENYMAWTTLLQQKKSRLGHEEVISENNRAIDFSSNWKQSS